jgi:hypothetical protein
MSKRNSREAKARRRSERAGRRTGADSEQQLVDVRPWPEIVDMAQRGETLPCGCDAHELLHSDGWQMLDD